MIPRASAIATILERIAPTDLVVTTTGMISREAFAVHDRPGNFYMLGSMGLASSLGLGLALRLSDKRVIVLEGDGSALMSLGTLPLIAAERPPNLIHVVLDNEAYESTGGQPSISRHVDLASLAHNCGYRTAARVAQSVELERAVEAWSTAGPHFMLIKAAIAPIKDLPRVTFTPEEIRDRFAHEAQGEPQ